MINEQWQERAVTATRIYRTTDPQGWANYLAEAKELAGADAPITDVWVDKSE